MHLVTDMQVEAKRRVVVHGLAGRVWSALEGWKSQHAKRQARRHMRVVETLALGAKNKLVLVSCGGERFLVGTGPESVGTIMRVKPEAPGIAPVRERGEAR